MAAGSDFTSTPYIAVPVEPQYHNIITPSESMKKEYLNVSATPIKQWDLQFKALTSTEMNTILTHYEDQSGGYYEFKWTSVPLYVNSGADITGHWVDGSLRISQNSNKWNVNIRFEKSN